MNFFADIEAIRRTQIEADAVSEERYESEESEILLEVGSNIMVAAR
jgi:hypothetical protein